MTRSVPYQLLWPSLWCLRGSSSEGSPRHVETGSGIPTAAGAIWFVLFARCFDRLFFAVSTKASAAEL